MQKIECSFQSDKIVALCRELGMEFVHKFGSQEIEMLKSGEKIATILLGVTINPVTFQFVVGQVVKHIDKIRDMIDGKTENKLINYEKMAMQLN